MACRLADGSGINRQHYHNRSAMEKEKNLLPWVLSDHSRKYCIKKGSNPITGLQVCPEYGHCRVVTADV